VVSDLPEPLAEWLEGSPLAARDAAGEHDAQADVGALRHQLG
jgi:hypothetical protein